jgi:hypothetical protein
VPEVVVTQEPARDEGPALPWKGNGGWPGEVERQNPLFAGSDEEDEDEQFHNVSLILRMWL